MLRYVPSVPTFLRVFIIHMCWILSKACSASIEMIICFSFFNLLILCITLIDLQILKNPCIPEINPTYSVWSFSSNIGSCLPVFCWGFLHLCSSVILTYDFPFCDIFVWFWYQGDSGFLEGFRSIPSSEIFWNNFKKIGINFSLNVW